MWVKLVDSNVFFIVVDNIIMMLDLRAELDREAVSIKLTEESLVNIDTGGRYIMELATGYLRYSLCFDDQVRLLDEQDDDSIL